MKDGNRLKVGDKIVQHSRVYRIVKTKRGNTEEKQDKIICFKPYFDTQIDKTLVFTIHIENLTKANIRWPITKQKLKELLDELSKKPNDNTRVDVSSIHTVREVTSINDPDKNVEIVKSLWFEQSSEEINFTKSKQEILGEAIERLVEEVALVGSYSLEQAKKVITRALNKGYKK